MDLKHLAAQLRKPEGEAGKQVGEIMNKGNGVINDCAVEALALGAEDVVLEIGMGNGAFVKNLLHSHLGIRYYGVDYSATMIEEATRINKVFVESGRASFYLTNAIQLPFEDNFFNKIFTVNTIYFWGDAQTELTEINRVLQPGGTIVFAIRTKAAMKQMPFTEFGFTKYNLNELTDLLSLYFHIIDAYIKTETPYVFNENPMALENAFVICTRK